MDASLWEQTNPSMSYLALRHPLAFRGDSEAHRGRAVKPSSSRIVGVLAWQTRGF